MLKVLYRSLCPVCGRDLTSDEIDKGFCSVKGLKFSDAFLDPRVGEFSRFFESFLDKPRELQIFWAKRILRGESFAAVAPPGMGKTTFGVAMACYLSKFSKRSLVMVPTWVLTEQVSETISKIREKTGLPARYLYYHGRFSKSRKEEFFNSLRSGDFDVLVVTSMFLSKHFTDLEGRPFDFIFVDDVDSVLKASKNIDRILLLLGFSAKGGSFSGKPRGVLMVSTATAKKGRKAELFRKLLGFDVGLSFYTSRNVEDIEVNRKDTSMLSFILSEMGEGGLIFSRTSEEAEQLCQELEGRFKAGTVSSKKAALDDFKQGKLDFLVGSSHYYGPLIRGLDIPERVRYTVFFGAPFFELRVEDLDKVSDRVLKLLLRIFKDDDRLKGAERASRSELLGLFRDILENPRTSVRDVAVEKGALLFPDVRTYIQGSGRSSRLFKGGITKGASFLMEGSEKRLKAFVERARLFDIEFRSLGDLDFEKLKREIDDSRKGLLKGDMDVRPVLLVVESPTKAKQIARFFGSPSVRSFSGIPVYEVAIPGGVLLVSFSLGHVTDLSTTGGFYGVIENGDFVPIYSTIKRCGKCGYQFTNGVSSCPKCGGELRDSAKVLESLRNAAWEAGFLVVGTDPDSEGEKIAWDIRSLVGPFSSRVMRAEFHEVTKRALERALKELRDVDVNMVEAQVVRRVEDRWIGFSLSRKVQEEFKSKNLSAGRAQTPVLKWIVDRYKESRKVKPVLFIEELGLNVELPEKGKRPVGKKVKVKVSIEKKERKRVTKEPLPPYVTDSMLQDAGRFLRIGVADTMKLAQDLFELGLITYHRTDSTRVSERGLQVAKEFLGKDFYPRTWYKEGAHECIRPTRSLDVEDVRRLIEEKVILVSEPLTSQHFRLYDLIFRRFMASQCKPFSVLKETYSISVNGASVVEERFVDGSGRALELYKSVKIQPSLEEGSWEVWASVKRVPEKPLFTQSDVINLMKERGIGRPSTYAAIVEKLFARGYIVERKGRLIPTKRGMEVCKYLFDRFSSFVSEERTRILEEKMDEVERGEVNYQDVLKELREEIRTVEKDSRV